MIQFLVDRTLQIHSNVAAMSLKLNDVAKIIEKPVEPADEQEHSTSTYWIRCLKNEV